MNTFSEDNIKQLKNLGLGNYQIDILYQIYLHCKKTTQSTFISIITTSDILLTVKYIRLIGNHQITQEIASAFINDIFLLKDVNEGTLLSTLNDNSKPVTYYVPDAYDNTPEEEINNKGEQYEFVNHPSHYNEWSYEVIDMMEKIYGIEQTAMWCEMTAYKYAMRMGFKPTDSIQQEIDKRNWYLNKARELKNKLNK